MVFADLDRLDDAQHACDGHEILRRRFRYDRIGCAEDNLAIAEGRDDDLAAALWERTEQIVASL